jgi:hypothetical protein
VPGVDHCFDNPSEVRQWLDQLSRNDGAAHP